MHRLFLLALALFAVTNSPVFAAGEPPPESIIVSGIGEMNVTPDIAYVTFGVESQDKNAKEAQQKNAQISSQVERILKERFKLEKNDVKTVGYHVTPEYNYAQNRREFLGYKVSNTIQVSFRALKEIGALLDAVGGAGGGPEPWDVCRRGLISPGVRGRPARRGRRHHRRPVGELSRDQWA